MTTGQSNPLRKKRNSTKATINAAYANFIAGKTGGPGLLELVKDFAYNKVYKIEREFKDFGTSQTADDWAQEVVVDVWGSLQKGHFKGEPDAFYPWLHRLVYNKAIDAFNYVLDEKKGKTQKVNHVDEEGNPIVVEIRVGGKVPLEVEGQGDDGEDDVFDNPLLFEGRGGVAAPFAIPKEITDPIDILILDLIYDGQSQDEIAEFTDMTLAAIRKRLLRIKNKMKPIREAQRAENAKLAAQYKDAMSYKTRQYKAYTESLLIKSTD